MGWGAWGGSHARECALSLHSLATFVTTALSRSLPVSGLFDMTRALPPSRDSSGIVDLSSRSETRRRRGAWQAGEGRCSRSLSRLAACWGGTIIGRLLFESFDACVYVCSALAALTRSEGVDRAVRRPGCWERWCR